MKNERYEINLIKDRAIINILGEVCWGLRIANFEELIGEKIETVEVILKRLLSEISTMEDDLQFEYAKSELIALAEKILKEEEFNDKQ